MARLLGKLVLLDRPGPLHPAAEPGPVFVAEFTLPVHHRLTSCTFAADAPAGVAPFGTWAARLVATPPGKPPVGIASTLYPSEAVGTWVPLPLPATDWPAGTAIRAELEQREQGTPLCDPRFTLEV